MISTTYTVQTPDKSIRKTQQRNQKRKTTNAVRHEETGARSTKAVHPTATMRYPLYRKYTTIKKQNAMNPAIIILSLLFLELILPTN